MVSCIEIFFKSFCAENKNPNIKPVLFQHYFVQGKFTLLSGISLKKNFFVSTHQQCFNQSHFFGLLLFVWLPLIVALRTLLYTSPHLNKLMFIFTNKITLFVKIKFGVIDIDRPQNYRLQIKHALPINHEVAFFEKLSIFFIL